MVCSDGKASRAAKAMRKDVIVEVTGKLRHDRWKDRATNRWTGKVFIAVDPGEGSVRSKSLRNRMSAPTRRETS